MTKSHRKWTMFIHPSTSSVKPQAEQMKIKYLETLGLVKYICILGAEREAALTVHVTWIVVGLRTTGLCNRTMTSPSSFCTCLWSTPWAGGLISKREQKEGTNGKKKDSERWLKNKKSVAHSPHTLKLASSTSEMEWYKSDWIDQSASTKFSMGYHSFIWTSASSSALKWPRSTLYSG